MKIGVIGAGNLGKAIIARLAAKGFSIIASSTKQENYLGVSIVKDNKIVARNCDFIILTVKPDRVKKVIGELSGLIDKKLMVSFVAGIKISFLEDISSAKIARVITNMAIKGGNGISMYKISDSCTLEEREKIEMVLGFFGSFIEAENEMLLDVMVGISASGIAYLVRILQIFAECAKMHGLDEKDSKKIILQTARGAISLMEENMQCDDIIKSIASKGGTTEDGINELSSRGIDAILSSAIEKTISKCSNISDEK